MMVSEEDMEAKRNENCTLVILAHTRSKVLANVLNHYCMISFLRRIVIVWNSIHEPIPAYIKIWGSKCEVDVKFVVSKKNKLTNRYLPREEVETNCKFPIYR